MSLPKFASRPLAGSQTSGRLRVMIVDDSAVIRGLLKRFLDEDPELEVVALASNGQQAVDMLDKHDPDLVILDIEMPVMDGMTALPLILAKSPAPKVLMASTLTARNAAISLKALELGASDYITKPAAQSSALVSDGFKSELNERLKAIGTAARKKQEVGDAQSKRQPGEAKTVPTSAGERKLYAGAVVTLRQAPTAAPRVLAIGSSTGGPQALSTVLGRIGAKFEAPILITQHMPPTFTAILADNLASTSGIKAAEAVEGESVLPGRIYVAPGDHHMTVERSKTGVTVHLNQGPQENFCRPSVDPMLRSLASVYGGNVLALILTGMGHDGTEGAKAIVSKNGHVIAQDEATSVVWGMPGSVATAGLCCKVLQLSDIGPYVLKTFGIPA